MKTLFLLLPFCYQLQMAPSQPHYFSNPSSTGKSFFRLGDQLIVLEKMAPNASRSYVLVSLHSNESAVIRTTMDFARSHDVFFLRLLNQEQQKISVNLLDTKLSIDPNTIFTTEGLKNNLKLYGGWNRDMAMQLQKFARVLVGEMRREVIVSVHAKDREQVISDFTEGGRYHRQAKDAYQNSQQDGQDFFITTEPELYKKLKEKNYNVVLQNRSWVHDDGSLAVYCDKEKKAYIQIETRPGHDAELQAMLAVVDTILP